MEIPVVADERVQRRDRRFITVRPGPVEQVVYVRFAGLEVSRSKALEVSGIHRQTIRAAYPMGLLGGVLR
jgi:hypothetical protein